MARVIGALSDGQPIAMPALELSLRLHREYIYTVLVRLETAGKVKRIGRKQHTKWMLA